MIKLITVGRGDILTGEVVMYGDRLYVLCQQVMRLSFEKSRRLRWSACCANMEYVPLKNVKAKHERFFRLFQR